MLLVALAVKLGSRGPVFYRGQRVGKDERVFDIFKFRTLQVDAEKQIGARLLTEGDSVYTPIGKFLKKWKLDELPQLFNVIKGDMSLVGPGPSGRSSSISSARDPQLCSAVSGPAGCHGTRQPAAATGRSRATSSATRSSTSAISRSCST
jgi:lipopolysaccharide/colanic/teichoic acid biosynthesis glycosyltransferase